MVMAGADTLVEKVCPPLRTAHRKCRGFENLLGERIAMVSTPHLGMTR